MNVLLQKKVTKFLALSKMKTTDFCRSVPISNTALRDWLKGQREISVRSENQIVNFMTDYVKSLVDLAND